MRPRSLASLLPRVFGALLVLPLTACEALFGGFASDNPESCTRNPALCLATDEVCSERTHRCEPAVQLSRVSPASSPNTSPVEVTLTGRNFAAGMEVRIGDEPQTVTFDSSEQLRIMLPARADRKGSLAIELVHPGGQRVRREHALFFYGPIELSLSSRTGLGSPRNALSADLNGDGRPDLILTGRTPSSGLVLFNNGDGTFRDGDTIRFSSRPLLTTLADLDRDGDLDLVTTLDLLRTEVVLNAGGGSFPQATTVPNMQSAYGLRAVDVTGDQIPDLLSLEDRSFAIRRGKGDGTFQDKQELLIANLSFGINAPLVPVDLDGDGRLDVIIGNNNDPQITLLHGEPDGRFTLTEPVAVDQPITQIDAEDLDFDGRRDLIVRHPNSSGLLSVLRGLGGLRFEVAQKLTLPSGSASALVRDLNGDGSPDVAVLNSYRLSDNLLIFASTGDLRFIPGPTFTLPTGLSDGCTGDWDGDGKPDLALPTQNVLTLARNTSP